MGFLFCIPFFLWTDAASDPTLALRQTYLAVLLFGAVLFLSLKKISVAAPVSIVRSATLLGLAGYVLVCWLSIVHSQDISLSLYKLSKITLFYFLILFFCRLCLLPSSGFLKNTVSLLTLSSAVFICIGYAQFFYYTRFFAIDIQNLSHLVYATFGNRNIFSEIILLFIPFQVIFFFQHTDRWIRRAVILLTGLSLLLLLFLETRACWLALIMAPVMILLLTSKKIIGSRALLFKKKNLRTAVLLLVVLSAGAFPAYKNISQRLSNTLRQLNEKDTVNPVNERFVWWKKTALMIKDHPLTGVGPGNWMIVFPKYNLTETEGSEGKMFFREPHNDYLEIWAESGIFALLFYLFYLLSMLRVALKIIYGKSFSPYERVVAACSLFGILCFMIISFFAFPEERAEHLILLAVFTSFLLSTYFFRTTTPAASENISFTKIALTVSFLTSIIGAFNLKGDVHARKAEIARLHGDFQTTIEEGNKAKNIFFSTTPAGMPIDFYPGIGNYQLKNFPAAISCFQEALSHAPYHILTLHFLATSYAMQGDEKNAVQYYERALAISDNLVYSKINLVLSYYNLGQYERSLSLLLKIDNWEVLKNNITTVRAVLSRAYPYINNLPDEDVLKEFKRLKSTQH